MKLQRRQVVMGAAQTVGGHWTAAARGEVGEAGDALLLLPPAHGDSSEGDDADDRSNSNAAADTSGRWR